MVKNEKQHSEKTRAKQGYPADSPEPYKIGASTPFDFGAKNLTPYGGLFPVATMLEKLGFKKLVEETLTIHRIPRAMTIYQFLLGMVLAIYMGFSRLNHLRFVAQDPMLTGILKVEEAAAAMHLLAFLDLLATDVAQQLLKLQRLLRERVWEAANVQLPSITLDTDTTVHTLYGRQMGARKSYNPKNKGKKSYQPILTFIAETREYIGGELRNGDRPTGKQIARHLELSSRPCRRACAKFSRGPMRGSIAGRRWRPTRRSRLPSSSWRARRRVCSRELEKADWKPSPKTDADEQCEFRYQPEGWGKAYRFIALRYEKKEGSSETSSISCLKPPEYIYRVFVTDLARRHRPAGVGLQPARRRREPDQRGEQRCRVGGASFAAMGRQLRAFPVGDAGLQPVMPISA